MGPVTIVWGTQLLPQPWPSRKGVGEIDHLPLSPAVFHSPPDTSDWLVVTKKRRSKEAAHAFHSSQSLEAQSRAWSTGKSLQSWETEQDQHQTRGSSDSHHLGTKNPSPHRALKHTHRPSLIFSPTAAVSDSWTQEAGWTEECPHCSRE